MPREDRVDRLAVPKRQGNEAARKSRTTSHFQTRFQVSVNYDNRVGKGSELALRSVTTEQLQA